MSRSHCKTDIEGLNYIEKRIKIDKNMMRNTEKLYIFNKKEKVEGKRMILA